ncbi:MAG: S8 family serine peptidase [Pseudomonadota bacterium]|nr:S8 family serine peptidase [Pseudomonadota bacterium]
MPSLVALALLAPGLIGVAAADDTFSPGAGQDAVSFGDLVAAGTVKGRTGRLLVRGDPATVAATPGVARVTSLAGGLLRVEPSAGTDDLALARTLQGRGVRYALPDLVFTLVPAMLPDDPWVDREWHLENTGQGGRTVDVDIDAEVAWRYATGAGQLIAVLDSGVQLDHPDLSVIAGYDYIGRDDDPSPDFEDSSGPHGTGAAGIAAALGNNGYGVAGVAYDADVYAIRLIGGETSLDDLYNAFTEAVDAGASVLSNSWGFGTACESIPADDVFSDMFEYAEEQGRGGLGSAVVFAAGNGACDIAGDGMLRNRKAVVVSAVEWYDSRAWYSSYGESVDIAAPTSILTTDLLPGGYGSFEGDDAFADGFSGTSASTPVVAGVMALMFEANPRITAKQARDVLCDTGIKIDADLAGWDGDGRSPYYGCGRVDAGAAVAAVANAAPGAPTPTLVADTAELPRVLLVWTAPVDPDADALSYVVTWSVDSGAAVEDEVTGTWLDLAAEVVEGDVVTWSVAAVDPWGTGPSSESVTFTVVGAPVAPEPVEVEPVEETGTCSSIGSGRALGWVLLPALVGLVTRRRAVGRAPGSGAR